MASTMKDNVTVAGHDIVDAAKNVGHKNAEGAEKAVDKGERVSPPMPRGKPAIGDDELCTEGKTDQATDKGKQVAEKAVDQVSPPMPRGKPAQQ